MGDVVVSRGQLQLGKDDVVKLTPSFSQRTSWEKWSKALWGGFRWSLSGRARWARRSARGDDPIAAAIPARVASDGRVNTEVDFAANTALKPGETYSTPRSFVSVYSGDFYEPLRIWSSVLQKEGWDLSSRRASLQRQLVRLGYLADVTPAQMLGTVPKLKEWASSG